MATIKYNVKSGVAIFPRIVVVFVDVVVTGAVISSIIIDSSDK